VVAATGRQSRAAVSISHAEHGTFEAEAEGETDDLQEEAA